MLMQNFKTAESLNITEDERASLIKVLGLLERGDLKLADESDHGDLLFNMGTQGAGCGTPACIGGWVAYLMDVEQREYVNRYIDVERAGIADLYWGQYSPSTTVDQAATALRSYLTTGDARWDLAVA